MRTSAGGGKVVRSDQLTLLTRNVDSVGFSVISDIEFLVPVCAVCVLTGAVVEAEAGVIEGSELMCMCSMSM